MINPVLPPGVQGSTPVREPGRVRAPEPVQRARDVAGAASGGTEATPPPEVLQALDRAAQVLDDLTARQINLQFSVDEETQSIRVKVTDGEGKLVREIPPTRMLDILAGAPASGLLVDAVG